MPFPSWKTLSLNLPVAAFLQLTLFAALPSDHGRAEARGGSDG